MPRIIISSAHKNAFGFALQAAALFFSLLLMCLEIITLRGYVLGGILGEKAYTGMALLTVCIEPLAVLLQVAAILVLARVHRTLGGTRLRLIVLAGYLYGAWAAVNLAGFLPLTFISGFTGWHWAVIAGQWVRGTATLLAFAVPAALGWSFVPPLGRWAFAGGFVLRAIGGMGSLALSLTRLRLDPMVIGRRIFYTPNLQMSPVSGFGIILGVVGLVGVAIYFFMYSALIIRIFRGGHNWEQPEGV
jgi:hypothetical protein